MSTADEFLWWLDTEMANNANHYLREMSWLWFGWGGYAAYQTNQRPPFFPLTLFGWAPTLRGRWL